jgi:aminopeptidase N
VILRLVTCFFLGIHLHIFGQSADFIKTKTAWQNEVDVKFIDITVQLFPDQKSIAGIVSTHFTTATQLKFTYWELHHQLLIDSIFLNNKRFDYKRDSFGFKVAEPLLKASNNIIKVYYHGKPVEAKKAPWDGGFVWSKDKEGYHWVGMACEGIGAQVWLPCKNAWNDEPDSVNMELVVPNNLVAVSNGKLFTTKPVFADNIAYKWKVSNPINLYNIAINAANYEHFDDQYLSKEYTQRNPLSLDYYVLRQDKAIAEKHFKQTHLMLEAFEHYFGEYPFIKDGYKMVQTPYWGMEHQSCVSYGNNFENNMWGFDFILVHESGHEWFGNSLTAEDHAEMWIHESFTTYSEALYLEYWKNAEVSLKYLAKQKEEIKNKRPIVGPKGINFHSFGDNDIYYKGALMLHTLRNVIDNDTLWFGLLRDFAKKHAHSITNTEQVIDFFNRKTAQNLSPIFKHYLFKSELPVFEYRIERKFDGRMVLYYRWKNTDKNFEMPIKVTATKGKYETITPRKGWQLLDLNYFEEKDFVVKPNSYLITVQKAKSFKNEKPLSE